MVKERLEIIQVKNLSNKEKRTIKAAASIEGETIQNWCKKTLLEKAVKIAPGILKDSES